MKLISPHRIGSLYPVFLWVICLTILISGSLSAQDTRSTGQEKERNTAAESQNEKNSAKPKRSQKAPFENADRDGDGFLTREEFPKNFSDDVFNMIDKNKDGKISRKEDEQNRRRRNRPPRRPQPMPGIEVQRKITYAKAGQRELTLDLYRPEKIDEALPLVIWIHGGGWRTGSNQNIGPAHELLDRGYAVASVEYRLSGEAIFPAAVDDCKAAVSFLRANAESLKVNPNRFGVWGSSAGGHLAAMIGTTGDTNEFQGHEVARTTSSSVQAVCDWFGPTDFLRMNVVRGPIDHVAPDSPESLFLGKSIEQVPELVAKANPITYVSAEDPPFFIMHGDKDNLVPFQQSALLHSALSQAGVRSRMIPVLGGSHGFGGAKQTRAELADRCADFFDRVLKK